MLISSRNVASHLGRQIRRNVGVHLRWTCTTFRRTGDPSRCFEKLVNLLPFGSSASLRLNSVFSLQVIGLELKDPVSKTPLTVQGLSRPLRLTFYVGALPEGKEAQCKFFDEAQKVWVSIGMTAVGPENGTLICESTHATFFAPSQDKTNATTTTSPATTVGGETMLQILNTPIANMYPMCHIEVFRFCKRKQYIILPQILSPIFQPKFCHRYFSQRRARSRNISLRVNQSHYIQY